MTADHWRIVWRLVLQGCSGWSDLDLLHPNCTFLPPARNGFFWKRIRWFPLLVKWARLFNSWIEQLQKGLEGSWDYLFRVSQSGLYQSWPHDSHRCVTSQDCSFSCENRTEWVIWKASPLGLGDVVPFHEHSRRGATGKHAQYILSSHNWFKGHN